MSGKCLFACLLDCLFVTRKGIGPDVGFSCTGLFVGRSVDGDDDDDDDDDCDDDVMMTLII
jgi:hypothetical protein